MTDHDSTDALALRRLSDLHDDALREHYAPLADPWLRVNFVSTVDGSAVGADGLSKSINNDADKRVFDALRANADCLVVGAGTLREEGYEIPDLPLVVVSRLGQVPPKLRSAPAGRILMATTSSCDGLDDARDVLGADNVLELGEEEVDLPRLKAVLAERGWRDQLCEGGPSLFATLLVAGVVDELCCTIVPRLVGGDGLRMVDGPDVDVPLELSGLLEQDCTLLGRWVVSR